MATIIWSWGERCKNWMQEDGALYSKTETAPAPSKDFIQVYVTTTHVIFRLWKIIPPTRIDANQAPQQMASSYEEFPDDERMRTEIIRILGEKELHFIDRLILGHINYLVRLPRKVLLRICFALDLPSISRLCQVNKLFWELCSCDTLWSKVYMQHTNQTPGPDLLMLVDQKGWKEVFFMNKLQLQRHLRKQNTRTSDKDKSGKEFFLTNA